MKAISDLSRLWGALSPALRVSAGKPTPFDGFFGADFDFLKPRSLAVT
jgi:hypothetical protein